MSYTSRNKINNSDKILFGKDLELIKDLYRDDAVCLVQNNIESLLEEYIKWKEALVVLANKINIPTLNFQEIPNLLEKFTLNKIKQNLQKENPTKIILGIAGPGAVGKETIKTGLGFNMVINTTTRKKRDYEIQDKHYRFISDEEYKNIISKNEFVISMERKGRGKYGIQKKDIENIFIKSKVAIIEENPINLMALKNFIEEKQYRLIVVYILPPFPIFPHLTTRLATRCLQTNEDFKSTIKSTLGPRQLEEFNSVFNLIDNKIDVIFLINDKVETAINKIKNTIN